MSCHASHKSVLLLVMSLIKMAPELLQGSLVCGVQGSWGVIDGESPLDELSFRPELYRGLLAPSSGLMKV